MKQIKIFIAIVCIYCLALSCKREDTLTPTGPENVYGDATLPQGNHEYDARILELFQKYNTLFLYKYVPHDLYYNVTRWIGGVYDPVNDTTYQVNGNMDRNGYFDVPANEQYIGQQLDLLNEVWLQFYPDAYLKQCLPKKVFLLDSLYWSRSKKGRPTVNYCPVYEGGDFVAVTWGGERITRITPEEKRLFADTVNTIFLSVAVKRGGADTPPAFSVVSNYQSPDIIQNYRALGIIEPNVRDAQADWFSFLKTIVTTPYSRLIASNGPGNVLHPSVDVNGLIRKKYDIAIAFFNEKHHFDLQEIGNKDF